MSKKLPIGILMIIGWILVAVFAFFAFLYKDNVVLNNLSSDAFGASLSIVLIYTITIIVLKFKKVF